MKTSCRECVFAIHKDDEQSGCVVDRLPHYISIGKAEKVDGVYTIDGLCNACTKANPAGMPDLEAVRRKVEARSFVSNTFVLPVKTWDDNHISYFIDRVKIQVGNPDALIVFGPKVSDRLIHCIPHGIKTLKILQPELESSILNFSIKQPKTQLLTLIEPGKDIPSNINYRLDRLINFDLVKFSIIKHEHGYHGMVLPAVLAKNFTLNDIIQINKNVIIWPEWNHESVL